MRVVISGSSGLIGGSVAAALRSRGDEVTALVRRPPAAGEARWDPHAGSIDTGAIDGADAVVHLAGAGIGDKRWTAARRREIVSSRVQATSLAGPDAGRAQRAPERPRERLGRGLLRRPRRRNAHRGECTR